MKKSLKALVMAIAAVLVSLVFVAVRDAKTAAAEWTRFDLIPDLAVPIVSARLNGSEGYPFLLDLSIPEVLLENTLIAGRGMELANKMEVQEIDYFGEKEEVPVVYLTSLEIGAIGAQGVKGLIIEGDDLSRSQGIPSYGRIGRDFLAPFRLTIYYPRRLLLLEPSPEGPDVPAGGIFFDKDLRGVNVETVLNRSIRGTFVIDPSVAVCFVDRDWARDQKLAEKDDKVIDLETLTVGGFTAPGVPVQLVEMKELLYEPQTVGVLGGSLLRQLSVTYDFTRGIVWLRIPTEDKT